MTSLIPTIGLMAPVIALGILIAYLGVNSDSTAVELPEHMSSIPEEYQTPMGKVKEVVAPDVESPKLEFVFPNHTNFIEIKRGESITIPVSVYSVDHRTLNVKIYVYSEEITSLAQVEHESSIMPVKRFPDGINAYTDVREVTIPAYSGDAPEDVSTWEKVTFNLTIEASKDAEPRVYEIKLDGYVKWEFEDITIITVEGNPLYVTVK
ncbi:MAG: hypothetical protein NZ888_08245 [Candidatus Nitrosocaldus sp.]|nr:hypothetical protein [Candidatus Nitrosocaldus sp.]